MYVLVPTKVFAIELMSSPETPKSQSLISPCELTRMLEGLTSAKKRPRTKTRWKKERGSALEEIDASRRAKKNERGDGNERSSPRWMIR